jgi:hypothetical protein
MTSTTIQIFCAVWGPGVIKILAMVLAGGVLAAIYNIFR